MAQANQSCRLPAVSLTDLKTFTFHGKQVPASDFLKSSRFSPNHGGACWANAKARTSMVVTRTFSRQSNISQVCSEDFKGPMWHKPIFPRSSFASLRRVLAYVILRRIQSELSVPTSLRWKSAHLRASLTHEICRRVSCIIMHQYFKGYIVFSWQFAFCTFYLM